MASAFGTPLHMSLSFCICRVITTVKSHSLPAEADKAQMAGSFPNLAWNAIGMEELRGLPVFGALPPVWDVPLVNPQSYRCGSQYLV